MELIVDEKENDFLQTLCIYITYLLNCKLIQDTVDRIVPLQNFSASQKNSSLDNSN